MLRSDQPLFKITDPNPTKTPGSETLAEMSGMSTFSSVLWFMSAWLGCQTFLPPNWLGKAIFSGHDDQLNLLFFRW